MIRRVKNTFALAELLTVLFMNSFLTDETQPPERFLEKLLTILLRNNRKIFSTKLTVRESLEYRKE